MQDDKMVEAQIKELFLQSQSKTKTQAKVRLRAIFSRGLHEIAFRDLLSFAANLTITMFSLMMAYVTLFTRSR